MKINMAALLCFTLVVSFGILNIFAGLYLTFNWIEIFTRLRGEEMALSPTSPAFKDWKVSPIPLYFDVYLFNWTNPQEFYAGSKQKPHFEQLGPYRFLEKPDKVNITWFPHNDSVTYRNYASFHFVAESSNGSLSDLVTSVNSVTYEAAKNVKNSNFFHIAFVQSMLNINNEELTITKTAEEWIFKGYYDSLVSSIHFASQFVKDINVPYDRIGYLYQRNDSFTYDGIMNIYTGRDNVEKMGQIHSFNYMNHTVYPDHCGIVKGSMGQFFPPNLKPNTTIYMFISNLCRAIPLDYVQTVEIHGIKAFKFAGSYRSIDNGSIYPENKCFCHKGMCEKSGTINISPCKYDASVHMSYPHFYLADSSYLEGIEGLEPNPDKHEFFITLEPTSGLPLDVGGGFQANVLLEPISAIRQTRNISRAFIPLMWAEERVRVPAEIAEDVALVPRIALAGQIIAGVLLAFGVILLFWYPTKYMKQAWRDPKAKSKIIINAPDLAETARQSVAQIKRPFEQMSILEFKQLSRVTSKAENTASALQRAVSSEDCEQHLLRQEESSTLNSPS